MPSHDIILPAALASRITDLQAGSLFDALASLGADQACVHLLLSRPEPKDQVQLLVHALELRRKTPQTASAVNACVLACAQASQRDAKLRSLCLNLFHDGEWTRAQDLRVFADALGERAVAGSFEKRVNAGDFPVALARNIVWMAACETLPGLFEKCLAHAMAADPDSWRVWLPPLAMRGKPELFSRADQAMADLGHDFGRMLLAPLGHQSWTHPTDLDAFGMALVNDNAPAAAWIAARAPLIDPMARAAQARQRYQDQGMIEDFPPEAWALAETMVIEKDCLQAPPSPGARSL